MPRETSRSSAGGARQRCIAPETTVANLEDAGGGARS
jgi:hypothetical protein